MSFFLETLIGGLMVGTLYSLVALGFVLIHKASRVFNFAQGAMVLFAALAMARLAEAFMHALGPGHQLLANLLAFAFAALLMVGVAWAIERWVLARLAHRDPSSLLMATLGVAYVLEGLGQAVFGADIHRIDIGLPREPLVVLASAFDGGLLIGGDDLCAAAIAGALVAALWFVFHRTPLGRALRAVADDPLAAQSVGISLGRIGIIVWAIAAVVALVAGMVWGSRLGVQFSLAQVALKALPAVILGGLSSVPGAIAGGLVVGAGEKLAEVFIGPHLGGGIEIWFAYALALLGLLLRPQGLFGEPAADRA
jgi:branched-chain amino acid transport system permease protein